MQRHALNSLHGGFTLIEALVVIGIVGIITAVAAPAVRNMLLQNSASTIASQFTQILRTLRSESTLRSATVTIIPSSLSSGNWADGWSVFVDINSNGVYDSGEQILTKYSTCTTPNTPSSCPKNTKVKSTALLLSGSSLPQNAIPFGSTGRIISAATGYKGAWNFCPASSSGGSWTIETGLKGKQVALTYLGRVYVSTITC
jgi:prepilin-type N-terminal cleavage/methylation domain-containing protein